MSGATGATGGADGGAAKRGGPGLNVPQGGTGGGPSDRVPGGFGPAPSGREAAGTTSMMPTVQASAGVGGTPPRAPTVGGAPRRRQGGSQGQQAAQATQVGAPAPTAQPAQAPGTPERAGYSTPTTYQKGQPTPARGTQLPPGAAAGPVGSPVTAPAPPAARPGLSGPAATPAAGPAAAPSGRVRRARLRIARTDPWSVMKVSFLLSIALGVITVVGVALLWMVLDTAQVFSSVGGTLKQATGTDTNGGFDLQSYLSFGHVMTFTALIAVIDVVLLTALATLGSFIYNTAAGMTGGVELTLAEEE